MRGLIYKDIKLFFRSMDKKLLFLSAAIIVLLLTSAGPFSGLLSAIMLSMTIGMQNVMGVFMEERVDWKKYQRALPVSPVCAVAGKYLSVVLTLLVSVLGAAALWAVCGAIYGAFDLRILGISVLSAAVIPLFWTGVCLPLSYWFGFRSAQAMGLFIVVPMVLLIKRFEDGPGFAAMIRSAESLTVALCAVALLFFAVSFFFSVLGYARRR